MAKGEDGPAEEGEEEGLHEFAADVLQPGGDSPTAPD